jgi:hypothetical protein
MGELNFNGNRHEGDIAIDELQIRPGTCAGEIYYYITYNISFDYHTIFLLPYLQSSLK